MFLIGCLPDVLFLLAAAFWAFGPKWSWIPFLALYAILLLSVLVPGPRRIAAVTPMAAQQCSSLFSLIGLVIVGVAIALIVRHRYWEIAPCAVVFLASSALWPKLRTLGPM